MLPSIVAFIAAVALVPLVARLARRIGLVDNPDVRKVHEGAVPLVGGLVIFSVYCAVLFFGDQDVVSLWPFFSALGLIVVTGALDDRFHIKPWIKFGVQILATLIVVFAGDLQLRYLGNLFGAEPFDLGFMALPFSIAAVMLLINAINLIDGLDGLAGGVSFVILCLLMAACFVGGEGEALALILPLAAAVAGFLVYNMRRPFRKKASVFLGDAGSMALGLSIAWFAIALGRGSGLGGEPVLAPISVAWILAVPIMDECAQFYRRVREGRHPFSPDRGHFHHHFLDAGFTPGQATALILLIVLVLGGLGYGLVLIGVPEIVLTCGWILALLSHMFISEKPHRYVGFLRRIRGSA